MGICEDVLKKCFTGICISFAIYMAILQIAKYLDNKDYSSVKIKVYNAEETNKYPAFSICFKTKGIYKKSKIQDVASGKINTVGAYRSMLLGTGDNESLLDSNSYENLTVDVLKDLGYSYQYTKRSAQRRTKLGRWMYNEMTNSTPPTYVSYQDPYKKCITRTNKFVQGEIKTNEKLTFRIDAMKNITKEYRSTEKAKFFVYVHYPGQLVRNFNPARLFENINDLRNGTTVNYEFTINHVQVIRERHDAKPSCDKYLLDDDAKWRKTVVSNIGCVPNYWSRYFIIKDGFSKQFRNCKTVKDYKILKEWLHNGMRNIWSSTKLYDPPCTTMLIQLYVSKKESKTMTGEENLLAFNFVPIGEKYEEISAER